MKIFIAALTMGTALATFAYADDKKPEVPQCLEEKIAVTKLQQENAKILQQLMQVQFGTSQQAEKAAKAEEERLQGLLPKPKTEKDKK